jgi:hypothetical protein
MLALSSYWVALVPYPVLLRTFWSRRNDMAFSAVSPDSFD